MHFLLCVVIRQKKNNNGTCLALWAWRVIGYVLVCPNMVILSIYGTKKTERCHAPLLSASWGPHNGSRIHAWAFCFFIIYLKWYWCFPNSWGLEKVFFIIRCIICHLGNSLRLTFQRQRISHLVSEMSFLYRAHSGTNISVPKSAVMPQWIRALLQTLPGR